MKTVVLGANSQLAKCLKDLAPQYKYVDRSQLDANSYTLTQLSSLLEGHERVINCIAYTDVAKAEVDATACYTVNTQFVKDLATVCKSSNKHLVHISTDYVVDSNLTVYGHSKKVAEHLVTNIMQNASGIKQPYTIIRTSALFSEHATQSFLTKILAQLKAGNKVNINYKMHCQPTYAKDLALFIVLLEDTGVVNFCNVKSVSFSEFAQNIAKLAGYDSSYVLPASSDISLEPRPVRPNLTVVHPVPDYVYSLSHCLSLMKDR